MTFVSPLFLWALAAVAVPIVIHLFNFRKYQKVYFTNVRFLKDLQQESKSKSRLKEWLILLFRSCVIICLVLAFSQPYIPAESDQLPSASQKLISIYLDNSFSMQGINKQGPVFEIAKQQAKELIKSKDNATKFHIVTNDFEGRHQRFLYKEDALQAIDEVKISAVTKQLSQVLKRQNDFLNTVPMSHKLTYQFSDAQKRTFDLLQIQPDSSILTTIIPMKANLQHNVYIDSCWFESPIQQKGSIQKLHVVVKNSGSNPISSGSAKLHINSKQIGIASYSLNANAKSELIFTFECKETGFNFGSVTIEDYPVTFDDQMYFAFNSLISMNVCLINGINVTTENPLKSLFTRDSLFRFKELREQGIDYNEFKSADLLILNQLSSIGSGLFEELKKYTGKGGAIVIVPSLSQPVSNYNTLLNTLNLPEIVAFDSTQMKADKIEVNAEFFKSVFEKVDDKLLMPMVFKHAVFAKNKYTAYETLLTLQNGEPFFGRSKANNALVYLFASSINESATNFPKHALFVPVCYQMAFSSLTQMPLFYPVSAAETIQLKSDSISNDQPPHIIKTDNSIDVIPEIRKSANTISLFTQTQIKEPGFYHLSFNNTFLIPLAFNYSRVESDLHCYSIEEMDEIIKSKEWKNIRLLDTNQTFSAEMFNEGVEAVKLWKLFIILALFFIVLEVITLRLLK